MCKKSSGQRSLFVLRHYNKYERQSTIYTNIDFAECNSHMCLWPLSFSLCAGANITYDNCAWSTSTLQTKKRKTKTAHSWWSFSSKLDTNECSQMIIWSYHMAPYQCCIDVYSDSQYLFVIPWLTIRREQLERELAAGEVVPFRSREVPTTSMRFQWVALGFILTLRMPETCRKITLHVEVVNDVIHIWSKEV